MKTSPVVTMNTNEFIKKTFGLYNADNAEIIWAIADNEKKLQEGCTTYEEYEVNLKEFVIDYIS